MQLEFLIINIIGFLISAFSVYVTVELYRKYRLRRTLAFVFTSINVLLWNLCHVLYDLVPEGNYDQARIVYVLAQISGMLIILGTLAVFSLLRHEHLHINIVFYVAILVAFATGLILRKDWMDITYDTTTKAWYSQDYNSTVWNLYSLAIVIMLVIELLWPLIRYYLNTSGASKKNALYLLIFVFVAQAANLLLPVLLSLGLPAVTRYLIANVGFLGIFWIFYRHPFVGIQDSVEIKQILISTDAGLPIFTTADLGSAALDSAAIYGINTILSEITGQTDFDEEEEVTRKIELSRERFFMAKERQYIIIYQYINHSGVCSAKFTSLARIFMEEQDEDALIDDFKRSFIEYYPHMAAFITMQEQVIT